MKKASLIVLYGLFMVFSLFLSWGIVLAQVDPNNPQGQNSPAYWDTEIWINFWDGCLTGMWKWCFDYEKMIWIDKSQNQNITTKSIAQDVLLAATYMVWTVLTVVIIYCWLGYIFAAKWWKDPKEYKDWLVKAAIWALLVRWAYAIVRLIQYIAKW
jgi:hypothetical protein